MANIYVRSGASGSGTGADWANAFTTLSAAATAGAAGDTYYVAADHAESTASAVTLSFKGTSATPDRVLCAIHTGSVPPVSADLRTTASVATTGANGITIEGAVYVYGVQFNCSTGGTSAFLAVGANGNLQIYDSCALAIGNTSTLSYILCGSTSANVGYRTVLRNTTLSFGNAAQFFSVRGGDFVWTNTPTSAIGGTVPTTLFKAQGSARSGSIHVEGVDLSALDSGKTLVGALTTAQPVSIVNCKVHASVTMSATPPGSSTCRADFIACNSGAGVYRNERYRYQGTMTTDAAVGRTGGASDGTTAISWKIATTANAKWFSPFEAPPIARWNETTGSNVTVTVEGVWNSANLPNNDEIWFELRYLDSSGSPISTFSTGTKADVLASGSALTASTQAWDANVTARANSTAYSLGDVRKVASNPGRIFVCTTAGTTAASEPAGYASAVDGGSVTDGTATFRAARRFKYAVTVSPEMRGPLVVIPKMAATSAMAWIDPKLTIS